MRHHPFVIAVVLMLTACTPLQVSTAFAKAGHDITWAEAEAVSEWTEQQDCLPGYETDSYTECAVADSWRHYQLPVPLAEWARIAACESGLNPAAVNSGGYAGLYQQSPSYWQGRLEASGWAGSVLNARTNAFVSAWLASSSLSHWNQCR